VRERQPHAPEDQGRLRRGPISAIILTAAPSSGAISLMSPDFYGEVIGEPFIQTGLLAMFIWWPSAT